MFVSKFVSKPREDARSTVNPSLYRIAEFPELFADACLRNSEGELKFLSFYGRDGSVMQFLAALEIGPREGGVSRFHLEGEDGEHHRVDAGAAANLSKFSGRLTRQNLFGPLSQTWLYDNAFGEFVPDPRPLRPGAIPSRFDWRDQHP